MTPEERAETLTPAGQPIPNSPKALFLFRAAIAAEIRAAVIEAMDSDEVVGNQLRLARAEAYADAAKIAGQEWADHIAERIRARAAEVVKDSLPARQCGRSL